MTQNSEREQISRERLFYFERDTVLVSDVEHLQNF